MYYKASYDRPSEVGTVTPIVRNDETIGYLGCPLNGVYVAYSADNTKMTRVQPSWLAAVETLAHMVPVPENGPMRYVERAGESDDETPDDVTPDDGVPVIVVKSWII